MGRRIAPDHLSVAENARRKNGRWVLAAVYPSMESGRSAARRIPQAQRMPAYSPPGTYEAYSAEHDQGTAVWVRYMAGLPKPALKPPAMKYRVCDRGAGRAYQGVRVVTVVVASECPRCGGPRGIAIPHRFAEDGEWHVVDKWENPCGHVDMYEAVLAEGHTLARAAGDFVPEGSGERRSEDGEYRKPLLFLRSLKAREPFTTARRAALLLAVAGYDEPARRIEEACAPRGGRMSLRESIQFLLSLAAARQFCTECTSGRIEYQTRDGEFVSLRCGRCLRDAAPAAERGARRVREGSK